MTCSELREVVDKSLLPWYLLHRASFFLLPLPSWVRDSVPCIVGAPTLQRLRFWWRASLVLPLMVFLHFRCQDLLFVFICRSERDFGVSLLLGDLVIAPTKHIFFGRSGLRSLWAEGVLF
ncbi:amino acid ABC transporter permease [Sesbania bispinosa]|nr:amino acid ABC transporter permease [Sesbania bispinosa]